MLEEEVHVSQTEIKNAVMPILSIVKAVNSKFIQKNMANKLKNKKNMMKVTMKSFGFLSFNFQKKSNEIENDIFSYGFSIESFEKKENNKEYVNIISFG